MALNKFLDLRPPRIVDDIRTDIIAVSYTHLDVYKRQVGVREAVLLLLVLHHDGPCFPTVARTDVLLDLEVGLDLVDFLVIAVR